MTDHPGRWTGALFIIERLHPGVSRARFLLEATQPVRIGRELRRQHFDRHITP